MPFWRRKKKKQEDSKPDNPHVPPKELKPGTCECGHPRCTHLGGTSKCMAQYPPKSEGNKTDKWTSCACQIFIRDDDDDDDDNELAPETPSPSELEYLYER